MPAEFEDARRETRRGEAGLRPGHGVQFRRDDLGSAADGAKEATVGSRARRRSRTEWSVEARAGGVCIVRVVQSLFASTDDWDNQLEGTESGWPGFFRILRIYLTHFRGQRSAMMQCMAPVAGTEAEAWETLNAALGLKGVSAGQRWDAPAGVPALGGVVEHVTRVRATPWCGSTSRGRAPPPCAPSTSAARVMVTLNFYLYGDQAAETVARETPLWEAWIQERFPMPTETSKSE